MRSLGGVAFERERGVAGDLPGNERGNVAVAHGNGSDVLCGCVGSGLEHGAEGCVVLEEQPVFLRHDGDALSGGKIPEDDRREVVLRTGLLQRSENVFFHQRHVDVADRSEKFPRASFDERRHLPPVERADVAHGDAAADHRDGPRGLRVRFAVALAAQSLGDQRGREAEAFPAFQQELDSAIGRLLDAGRGLAEQIGLGRTHCLEDLPFDLQRTRCLEVGVDEHEHPIERLAGNAAEGVNVVVFGTQPGERRVVEEARMVREQAVQARELGHDVFLVVPRQAAAGMDIELLRREPFHAAGEAECAAHAGQRAEAVAEQGPFAAHLGQALVVVRLAVVRVEADAAALLQSVVEVSRDFVARVILEELGVSPLHGAFGEQAFCCVPGAAETFEQEDGFGKFLEDAGGDVAPGWHRNLVAGVAAEAIDAAPAPFEEDIGDVFPERGIAVVEFREIFPDIAPGAGRDERTFLVAHVPFGMSLLQRRAPAGVVDDDVEEDLRAARVSGVSEFAELIDTGRAFVEDEERGIDRKQILHGVGTAETSEARVGRGRRADRQEMENAAAERIDDVRQVFDDVAQFAGGRDDGVAVAIERLQDGLAFLVRRADGGARGAEHAREGAVNRVRGAVGVGMHAHAEVAAVGPMLAAVRIDGVGLGFEETDFRERKRNRPAAIVRRHGHVAPGGVREFELAGVLVDDLAAQRVPATEVGAEPGLPARRERAARVESE